MKCKGRKPDGSGCSKEARPGRKFCFGHDPANRDRVREITSGAGRAARPRLVLPDAPPCPTALADVPGFTAKLVDAVITGRLDPKAANAAGLLLNTILKAKGLAEIGPRLIEVEKKLGIRPGGLTPPGL